MSNFTPYRFIAGATLRDENMYMRIPLQTAAKSVKDANETGSKVFRFIHFLKHIKNTVSNRAKEEIKEGAVFTEKDTELFRDGKNAMTMRSADEFKRHRRGAFERIEITARRTKTAFASKRDELKLTAMIAAVKSEAVFGVSAMEHFIDIFKNGTTNSNTAVGNCMKMIIKNLLQYIHKLIIAQQKLK